MRFTKTVVAALVLSTALLVGCGQAPATDAADATQDEAAVEQAEPEPEPEPAMTNWQEAAFYERSVPEIASDLELQGFEPLEQSLVTTEDGTNVFVASYEGAPSDNPLEGYSETVYVSLSVNDPAVEGETDKPTANDLAQGTTPSRFSVTFQGPAIDPEEFDAHAQKLAEALGLGEISDATEATVADPETEIVTYDGPGTFMGTETHWILSVALYGPDTATDPDNPLVVGLSYNV